VSARFAPETRDALLAAGWRLTALPPDLSLAQLRAEGAPFKSNKYFTQHQPLTNEAASPTGDIAYRPGLMPDSLNRPFGETTDLLQRLAPLLPPGATGIVGSASAYVWLLIEHHRTAGAWLLPQCFTWCTDTYRETHLVVGCVGRERPLMLSPLPEGTGRGVGLMPLIVPT
jgi:hypothetical protein